MKLQEMTREELIARVETLSDRIVRAKENLTLYSCKKCYHLSMRGWTCPECGYDDSLESEAKQG